LKGAGGLLSPDEIKDDNASKFASRSRGGTTTVRLGVGAMNTKQRSRGGTTTVRLGVGAMNTEQRSRGTGAHSVGTVEELALLFLKNQSYTRKELRKACDVGIETFIESMKKHFCFGCAAQKFLEVRRRLQSILWVNRWLRRIESGKMERSK
jgi:hypothetical protein